MFSLQQIMRMKSLNFRVIFHLVMLFSAIQGKSLRQDENKTPYELNDYLYGTFSTRSFNGSWIADESIAHQSAQSSNNFVRLYPRTGESRPYFNISALSGYSGPALILSTDPRYLLIRHSLSSVYRHSTTALYNIYDTIGDETYRLHNGERLQIAQWSPDGVGVLYVYENNLYYQKNSTAQWKPVTTNGIPGVIYNGAPDWVYEEEVLGSGTAFWFSPDGTHISFATFNDTEVDEFFYFLYRNTQYPEEVKIRYPKVGRRNPDVSIYLANLNEDVIVPREIQPISEAYLPEDYVLYDMVWVTDEEVAVVYTNRVQNKGELVRCHVDESCRQIATYESNGWLELHTPKYNKLGTKRLEILPQPEGDDFFEHLVLTDETTNTPKRLTRGHFVVLSVSGWDEDNNLVYFAGTRENAPTQRQMYVVNTETEELKCLTCDMDTSEGPCLYANAVFSRELTYATKICQGPGPYLAEVQNLSNENDVIVWETNTALIERLSEKLQPRVKDLKVPVEGGFEANVRLLLPPDLDESGTEKYPAVVYVYAGPNSNQISDAYSSGFQKYIVTNRRYIYIYIDGRGSGRDGQNKMFEIYRSMGTVEIQDQIAVTKYLQDTFSFIDADKTGIWGWSYGGFATAWVLVQDVENVFKFGLSVAPVTSFIYYDTIYTERYMGLPTPEDNLGGYNNTDVTRNAEAFRGKLFFLIHGNADDNVHYHQSMLLSKALEHADILFRQQSYPDENHSLGGVSAHLYHTIDKFWATSLGLPDAPTPEIQLKEIKEDKLIKIL